MSSFLEPESSFARSTTAESIETFQSHDKKKWRAPVWKFCRPLILGENQEHLYCPHCPPKPCPNDYKGLYNTKSSANMATYLRRHHDIIVEKPLSKNQEVVNQQLKQYYHEAEVSSDTTELNTEILKKHLF